MALTSRRSNLVLKGSNNNRVALPHSCSITSAGRGKPHRQAALADASEGSPAAAAADPETVRLVTAATILASSPSSSPNSSSDEAAAPAALDDPAVLGDVSVHDSADDNDSLSLLDDLHELDADSLSLVVGILRQQQPLEVEESDVELSERLRDFLVLLKQRPGRLLAATPADTSAAAATAALAGGSQPGGSSGSSNDAASTEHFWAGPDEWADVRSALMSIGINASVDEEDDEDVWALEEEGLARRTRLLKSLPRLDTATASALSAFLIEAQQRPGKAAAVAGSSNESSSSSRGNAVAGSNNGRTTAADQQEVEMTEEEELWFDRVTDAYRLLWHQARLQQLRPAAPDTLA